MKALVAGGCFWCIESAFREVEGVLTLLCRVEREFAAMAAGYRADDDCIPERHKNFIYLFLKNYTTYLVFFK
jgi:hypothetical protein